MYRVMIVEDDDIIAGTVKKHLEQWQYDVHIAADLSNVMGEFTDYSPHIVLMDIKLPFYNGYHWCSEIRRVSKLPIMFLSSASDNMNIVMAMNMGADDFIAKPFDLEVLTVKIQALIRRSYDFSVGSSVISHKDAILNLTDATLNYKDEQIELTKNELKILQTLMENKEKIVSRDDLMAKIWESDDYIDENMPDWARKAVQAAMDCGAIQGDEQGRLGLSYKDLRAICREYRCGIYDNIG